MIKNLLLSLAVAAFSGVSSFVGSPKKAPLPSDYSSFQGQYSATVDYDNELQAWTGQIKTPMNKNKVSFEIGGSEEVEIDIGGDWHQSDNSYKVSGVQNNTGDFILSFYWGSFTSSQVDEWVNGFDTWAFDFTFTGGAQIDEQLGEEDYFKQDIYFDSPGTASFVLGEIEAPLTTELNNCTIQVWQPSISVLPEKLNRETAGEYGCTFSAIGKYRFDKLNPLANIQTTGGITVDRFVWPADDGVTRFQNSFSCYITLPEPQKDVSYSITVTADFPHYYYTIAEMNNCALAQSHSNPVYGVEPIKLTFRANEGYVFDKYHRSWEFAGASKTEAEYSDIVFGGLYEVVTVTVYNENWNDITIKVTAHKFEIDSYKTGFSDGDKVGYERGHKDGLVAGDSYGVWNWLKQAARTTGEFFNIPLLPGFSVGALVTALAGLAIIWLFIKGFLFK